MSDSVEDQLDRILHAIRELGAQSGNGWTSWYKVAVRVHGSAVFEMLCSSIASMPDYAHYFHQDKKQKHVSLSPDGHQYVAKCALPTDDDPLSPKSVAEAIRHYAGKLHEIHVWIEKLGVVARVKGKVVQAIELEFDDAQFATGTPVIVRPTAKYAWTNGVIVGNDAESGLLYVAFDSEVPDEHLPARLKIDRSFLLAQLASRIAQLTEVPSHAAALFGESDARASNASIAARDAEEAWRLLTESPPPWSRVLWGPPGAGKTYAIARFVAATLTANPVAKVLLVAPSNLAVDVLLEETVAELEAAGLGHFVSDRRVLRYGYAVKPGILGRPELLGSPAADVLSRTIGRLARRLTKLEREDAPEPELAQLRAELLAAQEELKAVMQQHVAGASVIATTNTSAYMPDSPVHSIQADFVLLDEASMTPPAHCYFLASLARDGFLLAGDPRQLGPVVEQPEALNQGAHRWMGQDVFEAAGIASGQGEDRTLNLRSGCLLRIEEQRRCAEPIWELVEELYPRVTSAVAEDRILDDDDEFGGESVVLLDTSGIAGTPCEPIGRSWQNRSSAELALEVATAIAGSRPGASVAIICPYRAQARLIAQRLRHEQAVSRHAARISVGTVHQFQGSAADTVILDLVDGPPRTSPGSLLCGDCGLRLLNVAITRAKSRLVVIADREWCRHKCGGAGNRLIQDLTIKRAASEVYEVVPPPERAEKSPYESAYEAMLGAAMADVDALACVRPQHRICRADGSLISRADFAVPHLRYAIYVDGPAWHLIPRAWKRDRRLRSELRENGWEVTVFPAYEVAGNVAQCVDEIRETILRIETKGVEAESESGTE